MATAPCRTCGTQVALAAKSCPQCGQPKPVKKRSSLPVIVGGLVAIGAIGSALKPSPAEVTQPQATTTVIATPAASLSPKQTAELKKQQAEVKAKIELKQIANRKDMAGRIETALLNDGLDTSVIAQGKTATTLKITGFGVGRVFANKFIKTGNIREELISAGFKKVEFHSKYGDDYFVQEL